MLLLVPVTAYAGVFSLFTNLLSGMSAAHAEAEGYTLTSAQTAPALRAALNYDPNPSKGGGDITIVGGAALLSEAGPSGTLADVEDHPPSSGQISIYVVREGDSLSQIAAMFRVSANTILWANDISRGSLIRVGQTLIILPISGVQHTVQKGDTLQSIAKKYNGDLEEILQYNGLAVNVALAVGDIVTIPDGEIATVSYSGSSPAAGGSTVAAPSGYYLRPIAGGRKTQGIHGYNGVDLAAPAGTPIVAAASGTVIISRDSGWNGGYGSYVVIKHDNGTQTLYSHNSSNIVYQGQYVVQGQVIGYIGSTGRSTGPHVHFEVRGAKNPF